MRILIGCFAIALSALTAASAEAESPPEAPSITASELLGRNIEGRKRVV